MKAGMRQTVAEIEHKTPRTLPRGWVIVGLALLCWLAVIGGFSFISRIFGYLSGL